jgi:hypothetical protein
VISSFGSKITLSDAKITLRGARITLRDVGITLFESLLTHHVSSNIVFSMTVTGISTFYALSELHF